MSAPLEAPPGSVAVGGVVRWRGDTYLVAALQGSSAHLLSQHADGEDAVVLLDALYSSPGFRMLDSRPRPPGTQDAPEPPHPHPPDEVIRPGLGCAVLLDGLPAPLRKEAEFWLDHVLEVHTGLPGFAEPGTRPRPCYDPELTTLRERYATKAAELTAAHHPVSAATVERKRLAWQRQGVWGLVDQRSLRGRTPYGRVDEQVVQLLLKIERRSRKQSIGTRSRLYEWLQRACRRKFKKKADEFIPSRATFYRLLDRLGIARGNETTRSRNDDANRPDPPYTLAMATAPGEQVQIDTTALDLKALDETGRIVSLELTAAIDVVSRSILAAVVRPKSSGVKSGSSPSRRGGQATKAVDALLLLAEMCTPQPLRPHWSPRAAANGSDLPYAELVEADERMKGAAARPVIVPDMIVMDNGKVFAGNAFMDACAQLRITVRPACYNSPTHKAIIERTFGSVKSLFSQYLPGYMGKSLAHKGKHVRRERLWRVDQVNDFLQQWLVLGWQMRPHDELRSPFAPSMPPRTPNQMFAAHVASNGYAPVRLSSEDRLRLLPTAWLRVTDQGIRFNNRTYDGRALNGFRGERSGWWGKGQRWPVRFHPHQPEKVWLQTTVAGGWKEAEFVFQRLIGDGWTEQVWDLATAQHLENGGSNKNEAAIARTVHALLERAGRGPSPGALAAAARPGPVDRGIQVGVEPARNPYEGIPVPDFAAVRALPSMEVPLDRLGRGLPRPLPQRPASGPSESALRESV
ncbi:Mu transposase C-terminal domain-containing protein [Streptomyces sp. NPDC102340]|uniref:Mu transposase C-terminal domain-containing protein n=1 Tax=unclassified Streptomyces TaxID=2593676 RepID=UPI00381C0D7D